MDLIELGKITRPHGYKGDLVVSTVSGNESSLGSMIKVYLGESPEKAKPHRIIEAAWMPRGWKLRLEGVQSEAEVKALCGQFVYAERSTLPATGENEYYITDLIGAQVLDVATGKILGALAGVEGGLQDRWWIEQDGKSFAVPATKRYIHKVEVASRTIWLQNLDDLTSEE